MRVLLISGAFPPMKCGVGDYTARLAEHLAGSPSIVVGVLTSLAAQRSTHAPEHFFPSMPHWKIGVYPRLKQAIADFKPDIIHLQYPSSFGRVFLPNFLPLIFAAKKIPVVQTWHEPPIYSQLINAIPTDCLVVVDPNSLTSCPWLYKIATGRKKIVHIPISANLLRAAEMGAEQRNMLRSRFGAEGARLLVYFGFATPAKGIERLFRIADPSNDRIVLICDLEEGNPYHASIASLVQSMKWKGKAFVTGYLPASEAASLLMLADAAVFPFEEGISPRNGSVLAARLQGTYIVTTHVGVRGYVADEHTYYAPPGDEATMRIAVEMAGRYTSQVSRAGVSSWEEIALSHRDLYAGILGMPACCK